MMIIDPTLEEIRHVVLNLRDQSRREIFQATDMDEEAFAQSVFHARGFTWVGYHNGAPTAILGAHRQHQGVWSVFGFGTEDWQAIWRAVTRTAKVDMFRMVSECGCHRAHCVTMTESTDVHRWLRLLGATEESVMRGYGKGGEDYTMFSWTKG